MYVSDTLKRRQNKVLNDLMERKVHSGVSVITLAQGKQNHLEFFPALFLQQHFYDEEELFVVGLADGYYDAADLVRQITQEVLDETGGMDIRTYISEHQKIFEESRV